MSAAPPLNPIGTIAGSPADNSGTSWLAGNWWQHLQPGSWRGHGFVMDVAENRMGRRTAVHEYPYRDSVWVEDLGRLPRRFAVQAYLTGDDVYQQRDAMIAACEQPGAGTLVHPTLGALQVICIDFATVDRRERGRWVEITLQFILSGDLTFPTSSIATGDNVTAAAGALNTASAADLSRSLSAVSFVPNVSTAFVPSFATAAINAVNDPARSLNAVAGLVGLYGRYSSGPMATLQPATTTVQTALAAAVTTRQTVLDAAHALGNLGLL